MQRYELFLDSQLLEVLKLSFCPLFIPRLNSSFSRVFVYLSGFAPNFSPIFFTFFRPRPQPEPKGKPTKNAPVARKFFVTMYLHYLTYVNTFLTKNIRICQYFFVPLYCDNKTNV